MMRKKITLLMLIISAFTILLLHSTTAQDEIDCLEERAYHIVYADQIADGDVLLDELSCSIILGDLSGADLNDANLIGANLSGADLFAAKLASANLSGVIWENTRCPDGSNIDDPDGDGFTCEGNF